MRNHSINVANIENKVVYIDGQSRTVSESFPSRCVADHFFRTQ